MPWDLIGHDWAATMLAQHIRSDAVKHAYLLCGPDGVGRRSLALRFAQALTCVNSQSSGDPCLSCSNCQRIARMQHPDLFVVSVPENRKEILIEQVRTLQHDLALTPYEAPVRIGLLLNFQNASDSAQNAILKTLEEPTSRVILLVTASRPEDLLPTISSRCEVLLLRPASVEDVAQALEKQEGVSKDVANQIAHLSSGCYGQALSLHKNPETIEKGTMLIEGMLRAMAAPLRERFSYAEELTARKPSTRQNLQQAIRIWISFWRDVFLINSGADAPLVHVQYDEVLRALAASISLAEIHTLLTHLEDGLDHLDKNANTRLLAEILVMDLPHLRQPIKTPI